MHSSSNQMNVTEEMSNNSDLVQNIQFLTKYLKYLEYLEYLELGQFCNFCDVYLKAEWQNGIRVVKVVRVSVP